VNKVAALIVAAGRGTRFLSPIPKQYQLINGISALEASIKAFMDLVDYIQVVIHPDDIDFFQPISKRYNLLPACWGGNSRQNSVHNGLLALKNLNISKVLIHDAVRPFVSKSIIQEIITKLDTVKAVTAGFKAVDTIKMVKDSIVVGNLDRDYLYHIQTPQGFDYPTILDIHQRIDINVTDDASIAEHFGIKVYIVDSLADNIKITYLQDIKMEYETRIGCGFDAHRFCDPKENENNYIMLGCVQIPYSQSIDAHSDGDVVLHSIIDALLGAIGVGDIGLYFPPSDNKWKNADSKDFIIYTHNLIKDRGGQIINIDVTIICEKPHISPYRDQIRESIATVLELDQSRINIKATTTEKMGFTGRKEGIAVQAVAGIKLPL
jgi:2-C-methyl-D-erythritol 4-phosphate cytidylyltransferase/2-C-methyl-D-erythritol 2,4-cyclodiphosphate synthase